MRAIAGVIICCSILLLTACLNHQGIVSTSQVQAACKVSCQQRLNTCNQFCHHNCRQCAAFSNQTTTRSYNKYKHEQCVRGGIIARELNSYRDPLQCRKTTCDCPADYRVCIQSCAGVINKRLQVAPTCC